MLAGDEAANTQDGNNNPYCQDNEVGWVDWSRSGSADDLTDFVGHLTTLRQRFPQLKPHRWLIGKIGVDFYDVKWLTPAGTEMQEVDWTDPEERFLSYILAPPLPEGEPLYVILNAADKEVEAVAPDWPNVSLWDAVLDTGEGREQAGLLPVGATWTVPARCVLGFAGRP
jgi:glycogen operon protein